MPNAAEIILPGRCPDSGDVAKDLKIQKQKANFWWGMMALSVVTCATMPAFRRLDRISKRSMWIGIGVSSGTGLLSGCFALTGSAVYAGRGLSEKVGGFWEDSSALESKMKDVSGFFSEFKAELAISLIEQTLAQEENPRGFCWKVTAPNGQEHYLVGTLHMATQAMCDQPEIQAAWKASKVIITEVGKGAFSYEEELAQASLFESFPLQMDLELSRQTRESKTKTLLGLETMQDQLEEFQKVLAAQEGEGAPFKEAVRMQRVIKAWQEGSERIEKTAVNAISKREKIFIHGRTAKWLREGKDLGGLGLIDYLQNSKKSCMVAVGVSHCLGKRGITRALEKAGFTVERQLPAASDSDSTDRSESQG